jgi:hypothetical protein
MGNPSFELSLRDGRLSCWATLQNTRIAGSALSGGDAAAHHGYCDGPSTRRGTHCRQPENVTENTCGTSRQFPVKDSRTTAPAQAPVDAGRAIQPRQPPRTHPQHSRAQSPNSKLSRLLSAPRGRESRAWPVVFTFISACANRFWQPAPTDETGSRFGSKECSHALLRLGATIRKCLRVSAEPPRFLEGLCE